MTQFRKLICLTALFPFLAGCQSGPVLKDANIEHETKFGGVYIKITNDDFFAKGFKAGDSLNLNFSTGDTFEDIPFYTGYYCETGGKLVVAYPGYPYIEFTENNGNDLYVERNLTEETTVSVSVNQAGKYKSFETTFSKVYTDNRLDYDSDEIFGNFREIKVGNIPEGLLYRGASPCDNEHGRAVYVCPLLQKYKIENVLDLSDSPEEIETYYQTKMYPYWNELKDQDKVFTYGLGSNYRKDAYKSGIGQMMEDFLGNDGSFYLHCVEGKDRTGFAALLFESLGNASIEEIRNDYWITYENYFHVTKDNDREFYDAIIGLRFNDFLKYLSSLVDGYIFSLDTITNEILKSGVKTYLLECGLETNDIEGIEEKLDKSSLQ